MHKSEKFWDRMAKNFDDGNGAYEEAYIQTLTKYLNRSDTVLDFACGTASLSILLAGSVKEIHATDISSQMLEFGQTKSVKEGVANIEFIHGTLFDARFTKESYDVIFACNILHLLPEPQQEIQRIYDLLKPGGIFISDTVCLGENRPIYLMILTILNKLRLIPSIKFFKTQELAHLISKSFKPMESETLNNAPLSYLVIAEKVEG